MDSHSSFDTAVDDEAGLARRFWTKFKKHAVFSQYDPFVVALAAGTLKRESFLNFTQQDAYFLKKYAEACKMADDCTDNDEDKILINNIRKTVEKELVSLQNTADNMHNSLPKACDDESVEECSPNMATVKYTSFLLATAAGKVKKGEEPSESVNLVEKNKIPAYTIGAMTPCSRLYAFLGQEIVKALEHDISDHPYKQWIETYSSDNSEASASRMERVLDKLANSLSREELEVLGRLYYHALKIEREFFSAQPLYQKTLVPLLKLSNSANCRYTIVSDFELSCTVLDSSTVLSEIAILTNLKVQQNGAENLNDRKSSLELRNTWDALSSQYCEENEECLGKILPPKQGGLDGLHIHSNELNFVESISTGGIDWRVGTPIDKLKILKSILSSAKENDMEHISVYIGDSLGDLLCLLQADIGIVIGTSSTLRIVGKHFGVSFVPLFSGVLKQERAYTESSSFWTKESGILYTVSGWSEVQAFLLGPSN